MTRHSACPSLDIIARHTISDARILAYYRRLSDIPGWFAPLDYLMLVSLNNYQQSNGITGNILEIGAYAGKSAILLGFLLRQAENLTVCDIFDGCESPETDREANSRWYPGGAPRSCFEARYREFHSHLPEILERPSTELRSLHFDPLFRIIHIDGSHVYGTVKADLTVARDLAAPGAVVVIDDYSRSHAPGVAAATWEGALTLGLHPKVSTEGKLYAQWDQGDGLREHLSAWASSIGLHSDTHSVPGGQLCFVQYEPTEYRLPQLMASLILPPVLPRLYQRARRMRRMPANRSTLLQSISTILARRAAHRQP